MRSKLPGLVFAGILAAPASQAPTLGSASLLTARDCTGLPDDEPCYRRRSYFLEFIGDVDRTINCDRQDPFGGRFVVRTEFNPDGLPGWPDAAEAPGESYVECFMPVLVVLRGLGDHHLGREQQARHRGTGGWAA
jgi:hypothetical protein